MERDHESEQRMRNNEECLSRNGFVNPGSDELYFVNGNFYVLLGLKEIKYGIIYLLHFKTEDMELTDEKLKSCIEQTRKELSSVMKRLGDASLPDVGTWEGNVERKSRNFIQRFSFDGLRISITKNPMGKIQSVKLDNGLNFIKRVNKDDISIDSLKRCLILELRKSLSLLPTFS